MRYQLLSRLRRIYQIEDDQSAMAGVGMMDDDEAGIYLEFDGPVHDDTTDHIIFIREGPAGTALGEQVGEHLTNYIPERAKIVARRVCPCLLEWTSEHAFKYVSIAVPQLCGIVPNKGRFRFYETQYGGDQWARYAQRGVDIRKFLEANNYLEGHMVERKDNGFQQIALVAPYDDDLRYLLKLKFTRPSVDR